MACIATTTIRAGRGIGHWLCISILALHGAASLAEEPKNADDKAEAVASEPAKKPIDIWEYRVEGNTLLGQSQIENAVSLYLGPQRDVADIDAAANNLERAFRDAGYPAVFVSVPEQNVVDGVVKLQIVEGKIDRVRVEGAHHFLISDIRDKLPSVQSGQPLHVPTMQRELTKLNSESADLKLTPILKPGKTPGSVDIDLKAKDTLPLHGSLELNNYNSANTTESRAGVSLSYDNLWQLQHSFSLQWQVSPQDLSEVNVVAATYVMPLGESNNRLALLAIDSKSDVSSLGDINVIGDGNIYGARLVMPLPSTPQYIHSLTMGVDYKDYQEVIRLSTTNKLENPISYAVWVAQYSASQFTQSSQTQWSLAMNFGIRGNSDEQFIDKRNHASANFVYVRGGVSRQDFVFGDWVIGSSLHGQWSDSPLINNEQFSAGGSSSVRGYYESQVLGDSGATAGLEFKTPNFIKQSSTVDQLRLLTFIDGGWLRVQDALPGQTSAIEISSAGWGAEFQAWRNLEFNFDWAWLLRANGDLSRGDQRLHANVRWKF